MKQIASAYTYNKTSGVISLTGVNIDRDQLLLIVNTTRNVTYYNFADSTTTLQAFTQGANTSVTLASSVISASSAHTNADALTIYYDDQVSSGSVSGTVYVGSYIVGLCDGDGNIFGVDRSFPIDGAVTATDLGVKADAVATTDTGTFSVIAFIKRGLQNWTSLLAKIPALVSGRIPVDGSGVTQPVSVVTLPSLQIDVNNSSNGPVVEADSALGSDPRYMVVAGGFDNVNSEFRAFSLSPTGSALLVNRRAAVTSAVTSFNSLTSATLVVGNANRRMLTIQNTGPGILYLLFFSGVGSGVASAANFSVQLDSGVFYEMDYYSGQVNAIFATAGTAYVTSLT